MHESRNKLCLSRAGRSLRQTQYPNQTIICQVQSPQVIVSPKVIGPSTNSGASSKLSGRPANFGYCVENVRLWAATQYSTRPDILAPEATVQQRLEEVAYRRLDRGS